MIKNTRKKEVRVNVIPVDAYLYEASTVHSWAQTDKNALISVGLDWDLVDKVPQMCDTLKEAQLKWEEYRQTQTVNNQRWSQLKLELSDAHKDLLRTLEFALHDNLELKPRLRILRKNPTYADKIDSLYNLAHIAEKNIGAVEAFGYDNQKIESVQALVNECSSFYAKATNEREERHVKISRDDAYRALKDLIDEIRRCAKFALGNTPSRLKGYEQKYKKEHRKKRGVKVLTRGQVSVV